MLKCLLIEEQKSLASLYSINLRVHAGIEVIWKNNYADALKVLEILPNIDLVISKNIINDENITEDLLKKIDKKYTTTALIIIGEEFTKNSFSVGLPQNITIDDLLKIVSNITGVKLPHFANKKINDFYRVSDIFIKKLKETPCDVYISIKVGEEDIQITKIVDKGDALNLRAKIIEENKKLDNISFYVGTENKDYFTDFLMSQLKKGQEKKSINLEEKIDINGLGYEYVSEELPLSGLSDELVTISKAGINSVIQFSKEVYDSRLRKFIQIFLNQTGSYRFKVSQLTHILASVGVKGLDWHGTEESLIKKIGYASYFHDIILKNDEQSKILTLYDLSQSSLNAKDYELVTHHAAWTFNLLEHHPQAMMHVNQLILQHHGSNIGIGFPDYIAYNVLPLSSLFMISEMYAKYIILYGQKDINHELIMEQMSFATSRAKYLKILNCFKEIL